MYFVAHLIISRLSLNGSKVWKDTAKTKAASESISIDCAKLWNHAPAEVKNALTLWAAKKAIKKQFLH